MLREKEFNLLRTLIVYSVKNKSPLGILLSGQSGVGKTRLVKEVLSSLGFVEGRHFKYLINHNNMERNLRKFKILVLDEAHLIKDQEVLFKYLPDGKFNDFKVLILITNRFGELSDALRNRLINIYLRPYTKEELSQLMAYYNDNIEIDVDNLFNYINNPREVVNLARFMKYSGISRVSEALEILGFTWYNEILLSPAEGRYISLLEKLGKLTKESALVLLGLDPRALAEIERSLVSKGLLEISPRGRLLKEHNISSLKELIESKKKKGGWK